MYFFYISNKNISLKKHVDNVFFFFKFRFIDLNFFN